MSDQRLRRKGSSRRSSRKRGRRRSMLSLSSHGGMDDDEDSILQVIENDNDDAFEINMNEESEDSRDKEDLDSEEEERRERRKRAEKRINEEIMLEKINQCKELIEDVKKQTWKMSKKLEVLKKAKAYVEKFEGKLSRGKGYQQRGKQLLRQLTRSWKNWMASLVPWEMKIKQIEGHFGSVVASYFVFLRWLLWISVWLTILPTCFIIIPELISGEKYEASVRKTIPDDDKATAYDLQTIWNAEGVVRYSLVFYGYYDNTETIGSGYRLPLAYLLVNLATFAYSFVAVLQTMAHNSRQSRMSNTDDEYTFSWKLFTEWDYMISNVDTAATKHASITTVFKETILEVKVKSRQENKWTLLTIRIVSNIIIVLLLALSTYVIQLCVERSRQLEILKGKNPKYQAGVWEENELTAVMTLISIIFPTFLDVIAVVEKFHPRTSLQLMLGRIFLLNLLNMYTLFIALYNKQNDLRDSLLSLESNATYVSNCSSLLLNTTLSDTLTTTAAPNPGRVTPLGATPLFLNVTPSPVTCVNESAISSKLREFCWETMIGQEVFKLTVLDTVAVFAQHLVFDVLRAYFVRYCNNLCCWDIEKNFPEYAEFKTAENILHLISNQGGIWLGTFFCPGLPLLNLVKLFMLVYFRCWTVLCYNVPEERIFRASRSNNFYYALLLVMLFLCMLPPLFAIVIIEPSPQCGPFSGRQRIYQVLTETMESQLPASLNSVLQYAASPGVILPVFMLLGMTIYYLLSVSHALKDANSELRHQLEYERTEGRRKVYAMADARHDAKGRQQSKGWGAAKSSFVNKKPKQLANTALSLLQAVRSSKGTQGKNKVFPSENGRKAPGNGPPPVAKKPGHPLLEKLRAAKQTPNIPVAVIQGKQSIKANGAAARERNKNASQTAFRAAILDFSRKAARGQSPANEDDDVTEPDQHRPPAKRAPGDQRAWPKPAAGTQKPNPANKYRVAAKTSRRQDSRGEIESEELEEDEHLDYDSDMEDGDGFSSRHKANKAVSRFRENTRLHELDTSSSQNDVALRGGAVSRSAKSPVKTPVKMNNRLVSTRSKAGTSQENSRSRREPSDATGKAYILSQAISKGRTAPERRRRLSTSSYVDESGYLSPFNEASEDDDDEEEGEEEEEVEEEADEDVDEGRRRESGAEEQSTEEIADEVNASDDDDDNNNNTSCDVAVNEGPGKEEIGVSRGPARAAKLMGVRLPLASLLSKTKRGDLQKAVSAPKPAPKKASHSAVLETTADVEIVNEQDNKTGDARRPWRRPQQPKRALVRLTSSGSITGPVPEIKVEDYSEASRSSQGGEASRSAQGGAASRSSRGGEASRSSQGGEASKSSPGRESIRADHSQAENSQQNGKSKKVGTSNRREQVKQVVPSNKEETSTETGTHKKVGAIKKLAKIKQMRHSSEGWSHQQNEISEEIGTHDHNVISEEKKPSKKVNPPVPMEQPNPIVPTQPSGPAKKSGLFKKAVTLKEIKSSSIPGPSRPLKNEKSSKKTETLKNNGTIHFVEEHGGEVSENKQRAAKKTSIDQTVSEERKTFDNRKSAHIPDNVDSSNTGNISFVSNGEEPEENVGGKMSKLNNGENIGLIKRHFKKALPDVGKITGIKDKTKSLDDVSEDSSGRNALAHPGKTIWGMGKKAQSKKIPLVKHNEPTVEGSKGDENADDDEEAVIELDKRKEEDIDDNGNDDNSEEEGSNDTDGDVEEEHGDICDESEEELNDGNEVEDVDEKAAEDEEEKDDEDKDEVGEEELKEDNEENDEEKELEDDDDEENGEENEAEDEAEDESEQEEDSDEEKEKSDEEEKEREDEGHKGTEDNNKSLATIERNAPVNNVVKRDNGMPRDPLIVPSGRSHNHYNDKSSTQGENGSAKARLLARMKKIGRTNILLRESTHPAQSLALKRAGLVSQISKPEKEKLTEEMSSVNANKDNPRISKREPSLPGKSVGSGSIENVRSDTGEEESDLDHDPHSLNLSTASFGELTDSLTQSAGNAFQSLTEDYTDSMNSSVGAFNDIFNYSSNSHVGDPRADYGRFRKDRPSLVPIVSDDEVASRSYAGILDFAAKNRQNAARGFPNMSYSQIEENVTVVPVMKEKQSGFTVLAITNGNLDLNHDDVVIDFSDGATAQNEAARGSRVWGAANDSRRSLAGSSTNDGKTNSSGFAKLRQKF